MKGTSDALTVGIALALIMAFLGRWWSNMWLADIARRGLRIERSMAAAVTLPDAETRRRRGRVVLPVERRGRTEYPAAVAINWNEASPEERAEAVLAVLPTHRDDENGVTARSVAHRLNLPTTSGAAATLRTLAKDGKVQVRWDKVNRRRRIYWKSAA